MRLEPREPKSESEFYTGLHGRISGSLYTERVEPANESGFPDVYFVLRDGGGEGTIELKYGKTKEPNLKTLCRGNQKAALLEYFEGGGRRRFALCYCNGTVYLWDTAHFVNSLRGDGRGWSSCYDWSDPDLPKWLLDDLRDCNYD